MNFERKKIQHEVLRQLENRREKFRDPNNVQGTIRNLEMGIDELSKVIQIPEESIRVNCHELMFRGFVAFIKNNKVESFVISEDLGRTAYYASLLLSEYDDAKLQADVSNSVIDTNKHQVVALWSTLGVAIITLIVAVLSYLRM
jgi:hypothetical protein